MKEKELIVTCEYNKEPQDIKKISLLSRRLQRGGAQVAVKYRRQHRKRQRRPAAKIFLSVPQRRLSLPQRGGKGLFIRVLPPYGAFFQDSFKGAR